MKIAPRCVIFAGPNGSGKSTLVRRSFADVNLDVPRRFINADDIARDLTAGTQLEKEQAAFRQARQLREEYRLAGSSFSFETVFSHPSTILDLIKLHDAGYETLFVFIATSDVEINIDRVRVRVLSGGHDVPIDKIRSRYERSLQLLPVAAEVADRTIIWDNTNTLKPICDVQNEVAKRTKYCNNFYRSRFIQPFNDRHLERQVLRKHFPGLTFPYTIERGIYEGEIVYAAQYYRVQSTKNSFVLHDVNLLVGNSEQGENVQIIYRDGYGSMETLTPAPSQP